MNLFPTSSAPASSLPGTVSAGRAGSDHGAAGRTRTPAREAVAPPSENNRRERELPAAEGATVLARKSRLSMDRCRFRDLDGHVCARRDGRPIPAGDNTPCWFEARAQVIDEARLANEVDAVARPIVRSLLLHRSAWGDAA